MREKYIGFLTSFAGSLLLVGSGFLNLRRLGIIVLFTYDYSENVRRLSSATNFPPYRLSMALRAIADEIDKN